MIFEMVADANRYASFWVREERSPDLKSLDPGVKLSELWVSKKLVVYPGPMADCLDGPRPYAKFSFNARAVSVLAPLIDPVCELVPFTYKEWKYWALHVSQPTDCLDVERSEYWTKDRVPSGLRKVVFVADRIPPSAQIFRIPHGMEYYVTETFKQAAESAMITGLRFRFAWSSDGQMPPPQDQTPHAQLSVPGPRIQRRRTKRDKIVERLWEAIDSFGSREWLTEILAGSLDEMEGAQDVVRAGPVVLAEALRAGISAEQLSRLCRSIAYQAVFEALVAIEEEGLDKSAALASLHESLLMGDPQK